MRGNCKSTPANSFDAAGRMLSKGSETFSYDADGNMLTDSVATYTWNSDNRLVRVEKTSGGCKHKKDRRGHGFGHLKHGKDSVVYEEYAYLPQDWRRITRKTGKYKINRRGDSRIARKEQTFVSIYDGDDESHEYLLRKSKFKFRSNRNSRRESLKLFREFVGGPDTDDIKHTRYNKLSLAMLKDGLGSTIALTGKEARPIARINYDAWGNFRWSAKEKCRINDCDKFLERFGKTRGLGRLRHNARAFGKRFASKLSPYLYTGRRYSTFTNQYFNRNRYYSPALGRFISKDPIGFLGGHNLWRYANNNPVLFVDPFGLLTKAECDALKADLDRYFIGARPKFKRMFIHWKPGETYKTYGLSTMSDILGFRTEKFKKLHPVTQQILNEDVYSVPKSASYLVPFIFVGGAKIWSLGLHSNSIETQVWLTSIVVENTRNEHSILELKKAYEKECKDRCKDSD